MTKKLIAATAVALAMPATASAQTVVINGHHHHHAKPKGYLYEATAKLETVRLIHKLDQAGTWTFIGCQRRGTLAINCAVNRRFTDNYGVLTDCLWISRVRKRQVGRGYTLHARFDPSQKGCRLAS